MAEKGIFIEEDWAADCAENIIDPEKPDWVSGPIAVLASNVDDTQSLNELVRLGVVETYTASDRYKPTHPIWPDFEPYGEIWVPGCDGVLEASALIIKFDPAKLRGWLAFKGHAPLPREYDQDVHEDIYGNSDGILLDISENLEVQGQTMRIDELTGVISVWEGDKMVRSPDLPELFIRHHVTWTVLWDTERRKEEPKLDQIATHSTSQH